ncbi:MAG: DNA polymerase III subunit gamma/tau [Aquihabitans sp.]
MAYQSLYRRYRPSRFSDVRGQEQVVRALRNAVRDDRVGHAYLFSGPRGTGKTSTARILAKALNCEHLQEGEPDGTCDSCLAIDSGTSYDVQELDAASNNGVENVRELVGRANLGSPGRTKVYILDEVHMLTPAASAALLKTLEEPPDHVVFVLATTDPHKVLPTIRSRTQHYEFHLLSADELAEHVAWVIHDAGLGLDADVIPSVVKAGAGSARDTLSALDRVAAAGGVMDEGDSVSDLLDAIAASDTGRALVAVADAVASGRDPRILGEEVLARLRDVFLLRMGAAADHLQTEDRARVMAWADQLGDRATTRALESVGDALLEMRQSPDPRIPLEVAVVKLTRAGTDGSIDALTARVERLEAALAAGGVAALPVPVAPPAAASAPAPAPVAPPNPTAQEAAPTAPMAPPRPAGRPADLARAELAARRAKGDSPPPRPGVSAPRSTATRSAPPSVSDSPASGAEPEVPSAVESSPPEASVSAAPQAQTASQPAAPSQPAVVADRASADLPSMERVTSLWVDAVLPSLGGLTKAMFSSGSVAEVKGSEVVVSFPNEVHRQKCEQKRGEVESALSQNLGSAVRLRLVVDEHGGVDGPGPVDQRESESAEPADDFEALGGSNVHDLPDAPSAAAGGIDALTEAFPGSTLVEET